MAKILDKNGLTEAEFLKNYQPKDYPRPSLTADILIFCRDESASKLLMIRRGGHPFIGKWALPGGFANPDETIDDTAARELFEETGINGLSLRQLGLYSTPGRDPRTWVVSEAYCCVYSGKPKYAKAGDDAADAQWFTLSYGSNGGEDILTLSSKNETVRIFIKPDGSVSAPDLAFDHGKMIFDAFKKIRRELIYQAFCLA